VRERIAKAYPGYPSKETAIDVAGDFTFWQPSILIADGHSKVAPCWVYRFDYATPVTKLVFKEATHGLDLPMLFGAVGEGSLGLFDLFSKRASRAVSRRYQGVFLDFVRGDKLDWPAYNVEKRQTLIFDRHDRVEDDPRQERRNAWADFVVS
jgi:para-nitrobenzyl esterase